MAAILGKKLGMTQVFREDGTVVPVTVIEAGPCKVTAVRDAERDGYAAVQLAFGEVQDRKLSKAELGHLKKAGAAAMRHLVEFRNEDLGAEEGPKVGDAVTVESFEPGQRVKVSGVSIGKGFQGGIKRHNFSRGPVTHGSHNVRAPGSIGASAFPARVFKGMRMPGQMGAKRTTQKGLEIAEVDAERNLLLVKGSVPGSRNSLVEVRTDG
jgi:large subunit ribosomal protein L3